VADGWANETRRDARKVVVALGDDLGHAASVIRSGGGGGRSERSNDNGIDGIDSRHVDLLFFFLFFFGDDFAPRAGIRNECDDIKSEVTRVVSRDRSKAAAGPVVASGQRQRGAERRWAGERALASSGLKYHAFRWALPEPCARQIDSVAWPANLERPTRRGRLGSE
jgi:hypothetical protein